MLLAACRLPNHTSGLGKVLVMEGASLFGGFLFYPCLAKGAQQFLNDIQLLMKLFHRKHCYDGPVIQGCVLIQCRGRIAQDMRTGQKTNLACI